MSEAKNVIRVFIADDHAMVREGLAVLVNSEESMTVIGQCGDGLEVLDLVKKINPTVAVLDISMPRLNGLDVCRELSRNKKGPKILVLTMHNNEQFIIKAFENGAAGYLKKDSAGDQLTQAIQTVARGERYLDPEINPEILQKAASDSTQPYDKLTLRERQVLQLIAEGQTNRAIAKTLGLAVKTIDTHRTRLMKKLQIHDQTTLVKFAIREGIVPVD